MQDYEEPDECPYCDGENPPEEPDDFGDINT